jgi:hypothetical protein
MEFENKKLRDVDDIAARIMMGEKALHPNQQKLDVHEPEKDELTSKDFEMLRNKKKVKEEAEETIEEATPPKNTDVADKSYLKDMGKKPTIKSDLKNLGRFITGKKETNEEAEQIDELKKSTMGSYVKKASTDLSNRSFDHGESENRQYGMGDDDEKDKEVERDEKKIENRQKGINRAATKLSKEEVEQIDELSATTMKSYVRGAKSDVAAHKDQKSSAMDQGDHKTASDSAAAIAKRQAGMATAKAKLNAEEVDSLLEYESKDGKYVHKAKAGNYGGSEKPTDPFAGVRGPSTAALSAIEKEKAKKKKKFSEMVDVYKTTGIKGLFEEIQIAQEEASQEEFNKELAKQKAKAEGKAPQADVAAAAVQAVKEDAEQVDERTLTAAEADKKEDIVKGMKKGIAGFKERYGKDAKSVMYATATARAKGE